MKIFDCTATEWKGINKIMHGNINSKMADFINAKRIKHLLLSSVPWYVKTTLDRIITSCVKIICINMSISNVIIMESHNDFDSNGGAFYDYLISNGYNKKYKIIWFLRNKCPKDLPPNVKGYRYNYPSIRRAYYHCIAKFIICGHFMIPSIREGQISYYTTHGAFGLKSIKGKIILPDDINYILTPSDYLKPILAKDFLMEYPNDKQIVIGMPYVDIFYNNSPGDLCKITKKKYKKTILWMPTFRNNVDGRSDTSDSSGLGIPIINNLMSYENLNATLRKTNVLLIIKIHPMQRISDIKVKSLSNILILDADIVKKLNVDNYLLMKDVDALISDYSSVAYDFLHLNKPIGYTMDDLNNYKLGLKVDNPESLMAGPIINDIYDLHHFISDVSLNIDAFKQKREMLFDKIWDFHDGENCKRLAEHMGLTLL